MGKVRKSQELTCPEWMVTMGDAMSLLVCFFVLLLTFSTVDQGKLMNVLGFMRGALGMAPLTHVEGKELLLKKEEDPQVGGTVEGAGGTEEQLVDVDTVSPLRLLSLEIIRESRRLEQRLHLLGFKEAVSVTAIEEGMSVTIAASTLFQENGRDLSEDAGILLDDVAALARHVENEVRVSACFSPASGAALHWAPSAQQWGRGVHQAGVLAKFMGDTFNIPADRFGTGARVLGKPDRRGDVIEILLARKFGSTEVSLSELLTLEAE